MKLARPAALELSEAPMPMALGLRYARGVLANGDDWTIAVGVLLAQRQGSEAFLRRARDLLGTPVPGLARVVDLGTIDSEAFAAFVDDGSAEARQRLVEHLRPREVSAAPLSHPPTSRVALSFDSALSVGLRGEAADESEQPVASTLPPRATRAVPQVSPLPITRAPEPPSEPQPIVRPRSALVPVAIACVTLGLVLGRLSSLLTDPPAGPMPTKVETPRSIPTPTPTPKPNPVPAVVVDPPPVAIATPVPAPRRRPASLEVTCDVPARVEIDGRDVGETPLSRLTLPAGTHRIRVEATEGTLRLLPHEETITVVAGDKRSLRVELR